MMHMDVLTHSHVSNPKNIWGRVIYDLSSANVRPPITLDHNFILGILVSYKTAGGTVSGKSYARAK